MNEISRNEVDYAAFHLVFTFLIPSPFYYVYHNRWNCYISQCIQLTTEFNFETLKYRLGCVRDHLNRNFLTSNNSFGVIIHDKAGSFRVNVPSHLHSNARAKYCDLCYCIKAWPGEWTACNFLVSTHSLSHLETVFEFLIKLTSWHGATLSQ